MHSTTHTRTAPYLTEKKPTTSRWVYGAETNFDIAQTLPRGELGESETQELVETGKALDLVIPPVALDATAELNHGEQIHQLRENGPSDMHDPASYRQAGRAWRSNRFASKPTLSRCEIMTYGVSTNRRWDSSANKANFEQPMGNQLVTACSGAAECPARQDATDRSTGSRSTLA